MKIAFEANVLTYPHTGIAKSLINLIRHLHDIEIILFTSNNKEITQNLGFSYTFINANLGGGIENIINLCDYVHYHWNGGILSNSNKNILMLHDVLPLILDKNPIRNFKYKQNIKKQIKLAKIILTPSLYSKTQIQKYFKVNKEIYVLPHGVEHIEQQNKIRGDYYIYAGGYDARKGLEKLLETFIRLDKKIIFVGEIKYFSNNFKALAIKAINQGILKQSGYVNEIELKKLIKNAKAMVYPSKFEGFGLPPLESMALGTPVITTPFSSIKEVCKDCALYFNPDENNSLYNTIIEFEKSNMKEKLIQMGLNNARNFSWEKSAKKYIEIIKDSM